MHATPTILRAALVLGVAATALVATATWARPAQACGGTFCDLGPQAMPVDQSGENILFVLDEGPNGPEVEVHIQIQYEGDPDRFAWVIPLTAVPDLSVGSEALFANLLAGTVPTYGLATSNDTCRTGGAFPDARGDAAEGAGFGDDGGLPEEPMGPQILLQQTVGAFEITVLSAGGGGVDEVIAWLDANGYQQDPDAAPILAQYVAEGALFGAIKLVGGADIDEIHPIVLRYPGQEPCVPLRLTQIAATEDMQVRTFFLADDRVVPTNYRHVLVNPLKIDWLALGANYQDVVTAAVDAESADGRAFVTEYAGTSDVVARGLADPRWDANVFITLTPGMVLDELQAQGLLACYGGPEGCLAQHPLIEGLLEEFLLTEAVTLGDFFNSPGSYEGLIDWQAIEFAEAMQTRIVDPAVHADELLDRWPYVTRMFTTISPHEMTTDPIFHVHADLPEVAAVRQGQRRIRCDGDSLLTLPDGREVYLPSGASWPEFPSQMPWAEAIDELPLVGAPMVLVDNAAEIDDLLRDYNASVGWPRGCTGCKSADERPAPASWLGLLLFGLWARRRRLP